MIKISVANTIESMYVCLSMWPCCFFLNQVVFQNEPCDKVSNAIYVVVDCTLKLPNLAYEAICSLVVILGVVNYYSRCHLFLC
ncbi:hypothetical protein NC653_033724 [Populus alba x Populus x berolinensis]|uniref:Uncharacterized protein n=1 Tax=Populus alba x Populus x berolinensis TaxID=444605 RepID=A0AAD6LUK4_9ROSI|nr:hypothetical protein NC653_033724 [Populus alba x Populus x berolinensis]